MSLYKPGFIGSAKVSHAYLGHQNSLPGATSYTFSGMDFGAVHTGRYLVACIISTANLSSVTIGGVAATRIVGPEIFAEMWIANVPTGTSGDVVINAGSNIIRAGVNLYSLIGISSSTPHDTASDWANNASRSASIDCPSKGVIICGAGFTAASGNAAWGNVTEDDEDSGAPSNIYTSASKFFGSTQSGLSVTVSMTSASNSQLVAASFGPN